MRKFTKKLEFFVPGKLSSPVFVRKLYLTKLSLIQMSELNNRLTVRNSNKTISQNIFAN